MSNVQALNTFGSGVRIKTFSATKAGDREVLGDRVTSWLRDSRAELLRTDVLQSSDNEFHCLSLVVHYKLTDDRA